MIPTVAKNDLKSFGTRATSTYFLKISFTFGKAVDIAPMIPFIFLSTTPLPVQSSVTVITLAPHFMLDAAVTQHSDNVTPARPLDNINIFGSTDAVEAKLLQ